MSIQREAREIQKLFDAGAITGAEMNKLIRELGTKKPRKIKPIDYEGEKLPKYVGWDVAVEGMPMTPIQQIRAAYHKDKDVIREHLTRQPYCKTVIIQSLEEYFVGGEIKAADHTYECVEWNLRRSVTAMDSWEIVGRYKGYDLVVDSRSERY